MNKLSLFKINKTDRDWLKGSDGNSVSPKGNLTYSNEFMGYAIAHTHAIATQLAYIIPRDNDAQTLNKVISQQQTVKICF